MKLNFNKRKTIRLSKIKYLRVEIAGFDSTPSIGVDVDGNEHDVTFHLAFGIAVYLTFSGIFPKWIYPEYLSNVHGWLPCEKEICIKFHHNSLWWSFWMRSMSWSSNEKWYRRGSIDFHKLLFGAHTCTFEELEKEVHTVYFTEAAYNVEVVKKKRTDSWKRWFKKESVAFQGNAGFYDEDNNWVDDPIPFEGKGESSYDQGEDATYSMTFPGNDRDINSCAKAALHFEYKMKLDRLKRGGPKWIPAKYRGNFSVSKKPNN